MKKKFKLLTSIASLGLALAVMAFGVFAATSHSFTITNKVQFEATKNVKGTVQLVVTAVEGGAIKTGSETKVGEAYENPAENTVVFDGTEANTEATTWDIGQLELVANAGNTGTVTYSYQVTITNNKTAANDQFKTLVVKSLVLPEAMAENGHSVVVTEPTQDAETDGSYELGVGEALVYTIAVTINANRNFDLYDLGSSFSLEMAE